MVPGSDPNTPRRVRANTHGITRPLGVRRKGLPATVDRPGEAAVAQGGPDVALGILTERKHAFKLQRTVGGDKGNGPWPYLIQAAATSASPDISFSIFQQ